MWINPGIRQLTRTARPLRLMPVPHWLEGRMRNQVLLIDHHARLRELLMALLVSDGYDVVACPCTADGQAMNGGSRAGDVVVANVAIPEGNWRFDYTGWYCLQPYLMAGKPIVAYALATDAEIGEIKDRLAILDVPLLSHPIDLHAISRAVRSAMSLAAAGSDRSLVAAS